MPPTSRAVAIAGAEKRTSDLVAHAGAQTPARDHVCHLDTQPLSTRRTQLRCAQRSPSAAPGAPPLSCCLTRHDARARRPLRGVVIRRSSRPLVATKDTKGSVLTGRVLVLRLLIACLIAVRWRSVMLPGSAAVFDVRNTTPRVSGA